jgi:hypothetical protein
VIFMASVATILKIQRRHKNGMPRQPQWPPPSVSKPCPFRETLPCCTSIVVYASWQVIRTK